MSARRLRERQARSSRRPQAAGGHQLDRALHQRAPQWRFVVERVDRIGPHAEAAAGQTAQFAEHVLLRQTGERVVRQQRAARREQIEVVGEVLARDMVEHHVDAASACERGNAGAHFCRIGALPEVP